METSKEVTLLLSSTLAESYRRDHQIRGDLWRSIARRGGELRPLHPQVDDARLSRYFLLRLPADCDAAPMLDRLRADAGVEAAYVVPPVEPPSVGRAR